MLDQEQHPPTSTQRRSASKPRPRLTLAIERFLDRSPSGVVWSLLYGFPIGLEILALLLAFAAWWSARNPVRAFVLLATAVGLAVWRVSCRIDRKHKIEVRRLAGRCVHCEMPLPKREKLCPCCGRHQEDWSPPL